MSGALCAYRNGLAVAVRLIRHRLTLASPSIAVGVADSLQFHSDQVVLGLWISCHVETPSPLFLRRHSPSVSSHFNSFRRREEFYPKRLTGRESEIIDVRNCQTRSA